MVLRSYVYGGWHTAQGEGLVLRDATTGAEVASASSAGIDFARVLEHARGVGGPAIRKLGFHGRAAVLKALAKTLMERKEELYALSFATGATRRDSWIDIEGGIGTLFSYASKGARELPDGELVLDGATEVLAKNGEFIGQHIYVPLEGAAVHVNAFNFPCWGLLEKLAPTFLAGVPAITKPATATAYLAARLVELIIETGLLPEGALQLIVGAPGDLLDRLDGRDCVSFTGSAHTASRLRAGPAVRERATRFLAETDSLNSSLLGPDALPGSPEFLLYVQEVAKELAVKAGQKCTAIRKAIVPAAIAGAVVEALRAECMALRVGDPRLAGIGMGPLASLAQREEFHRQLARLAEESAIICGGLATPALEGAHAEHGAFVAPTLLASRDPKKARAVHEVEAFGPACTVLAYATLPDAVALARQGGGSLVASIFTADDGLARELALGLAAHHGRLLIVNRHSGAASTGHGSPLPQLVHGGPGRAGGGEELGGVRGVFHYMQRCALQGSPDTLVALTGRYLAGATPHSSDRHPFRKTFGELRIGDSFTSAYREITLADIEAFAELSGDRFYAHMDEALAKRNPFFGTRVAHGYFLIAAAAGLFVDPGFGPVLANYGIDQLRFLKPVPPGTRVRVRLTCKDKTSRSGRGYGEVRWDAQLCDHTGERVASYEVLTMVSEHAEPDHPA
jgi:oxepin-CoA hydrolase / 3-oxo-5,6-dehydrosuberyl-CoA semialdehyde dehydrogenase